MKKRQDVISGKQGKWQARPRKQLLKRRQDKLSKQVRGRILLKETGEKTQNRIS